MPRLYEPKEEGFEQIFLIKTPPMPKPRMTQRDKWAKRPVVQRWNAYKDVMRILAPKDFQMPTSDYWLIFTFKIPKRGGVALGSAHMVRPDKDNLEKGVLDIFLPYEDSVIFDGRCSKLWGQTASVELWWKHGAGSR